MKPSMLALLAVLLTSPVVALSPPSQLLIARLVKQLGSDCYQEREAAQKELEALGERALPALQRAVKASRDAEVRMRARRSVVAIEFPLRWADNHRLYGPWRLTAWEEDGKAVAAEHFVGRVRFTGNWFGVLLERRRGRLDTALLESLATPDCNPDRIDWQLRRAAAPGKRQPRDLRGEGWFIAGRRGCLRTLDFGLPNRETTAAVPERKTVHAIYMVKGKTARLCLALDGGQRPEAFTTKGFPSRVLLTCEREP
jgi:hypothetical protein